MKITQLNATYVGGEDRVLFRFNTSTSQEYRFWFTRGVVRELLTLGAQAGVAAAAREHPSEHAKSIAEFKHQTQAQTAQFTSFVGATQFPLGADPVLVKRVRGILDTSTTVLQFELQRGQVLTLQLTQSLVEQLRVLLETIQRKAAWGLEPASSVRERTPSVDAPTDGGETRVVH